MVRDSFIAQGAHHYTGSLLLHRESIITQSQLLCRETVITLRVNYHTESIITQESITLSQLLHWESIFTQSIKAQRDNYYAKRQLLQSQLLHRDFITQSHLLHWESVVKHRVNYQTGFLLSYWDYGIGSLITQSINYYTESQLSVITCGHNTLENAVCLIRSATMSCYLNSRF